MHPFTARARARVIAPADSLCSSYSAGAVFARFALTVATLGTGALYLLGRCA